MSSSRAGRKKARGAEATDASGVPQKPKKVNSEIRKQQNRIASRNYREKRKRKLQYLQQLLQDQTSPDQQTPTTPELSHEDRTRSMSAEYFVSTPHMTPMSYASAPEFDSLSSTSGNVIDPVLATTSAFNSPMVTSAEPFAGVEPAWHQAFCDPISDHAHAGSWNASWIPSAEFVPQIHTPPPSDVQPTSQHPYHYYDRMTPSPQHTPQLQPADVYLMTPYENYKRPIGQHQGISNYITRQSFNPPKSSVYI